MYSYADNFHNEISRKTKNNYRNVKSEISSKLYGALKDFNKLFGEMDLNLNFLISVLYMFFKGENNTVKSDNKNNIHNWFNTGGNINGKGVIPEISPTLIKQLVDLQSIAQDCDFEKMDLKRILGNIYTQKDAIINTLIHNYPYINITRLNKGDKVRNFLFSGIKDLNDNFGQQFTDEILGALKDHIYNNLFPHNISKYNCRCIRKNYKSITFAQNIDIDMQQFYDQATKGMQDLNQITAINNIIIKYIITKFKDQIIGSIQDNKLKNEINNLFMKKKYNEIYSKITNITECKNILEQENAHIVKYIQKINIYLGEQEVIGNSNSEKLLSFLLAERAGQIGKIENQKHYIFDQAKIVEYIHRIGQIENTILGLDGKQFTTPLGMQLNYVIGNNSNNKFINNFLLKSVRKGKDIGDQSNQKLIDEYLIRVNAVADCIKEGNVFDNLPVEFRKVEAFDVLIRNLKSKKNYKYLKKNLSTLIDGVLNNQKGTLSQIGFERSLIGKQNGVLGIIDVKDMFLMNFLDNKNLINELNNSMDANGNLNLDLLLHACDPVTEKLYNIIEKLKSKFGDRLILKKGGDEIFFYINAEDKLLNLKGIFRKAAMSYRIATHNITKPISQVEEVKKHLNCLDIGTQVLKYFENIYDIILETNGFTSHYNIGFDIRNIDGDINLNNVLYTLKSRQQEIYDFIYKYLSGYKSGEKLIIDEHFSLHTDNIKGLYLEKN